jgi:uncharacterized integral membrane protein
VVVEHQVSLELQVLAVVVVQFQMAVQVFLYFDIPLMVLALVVNLFGLLLAVLLGQFHKA